MATDLIEIRFMAAKVRSRIQGPAYMWHDSEFTGSGLLALAPPCHLISDAPRPGFNIQTTNSDLEVRNLRYKTNELEAKLEPDLMMHPISCLGVDRLYLGRLN